MVYKEFWPWLICSTCVPAASRLKASSCQELETRSESYPRQGLHKLDRVLVSQQTDSAGILHRNAANPVESATERLLSNFPRRFLGWVAVKEVIFSCHIMDIW